MNKKDDQEWFRKTRAMLYNEEPEEEEPFTRIELRDIEEPEDIEPEETRESLLLRMERMSQAQRFSRLNYIGAFLAVVLMLIQATVVYSLERTQYLAPVFIFVFTSTIVYGHYLYLIGAMQRIREGKQ